MELTQQRDFEDRRWSQRDQEVAWRHQAALKLVMGEPVFDVGGGDGLFLQMLKENKAFSRLALIDISAVAVEKARQKGLDAQVADITKTLPLPAGYYHTACALDVLEHLYDPLPTLQEMARVACYVVIVVPNFHYWKDRVRMLVGKVPFQCKARRGHVHWFNYPILKDLISRAGLQIDVIAFGGFSRLGPVGNWLALWQPNIFAHSFAVRLRKNR